MAKGISIPIASDTREFASGIRDGVIEPLEDAKDVMKGLEKSGNLDQLERDMKGAQKATAGYSKEIDEAKDNLRQLQRQTRAVGDDSETAFRKAGQNTEEFRNEARQNFSEVTSSFNGSMDSIADLAQGTLGGLASGLAGPLGLAAGLGAAALGGIFSGMSAEADKQAQASEERISTMYQNMLDSGQNFITASQIQDAIGELGKDTEKMKQIAADAKAAGIDVGTLLRANAGDADALAQVQGELNAKMEDAYGQLQNSSGAYDANSQAAGLLLDKLGPIAGRYSDISRDADTAVSRVNAVRDAMGGAGATADTTVGKLDAIAAAVGRIPNGKSINIDATTAAFDAKMRALEHQWANSTMEIMVTPRTGRGIN